MALRALSTGHPRTQRLLEAGRGLVAHREGPAVRALARAPLLAPTSHAGATSGPRPAEPRRPGLLVATTEPSKRRVPGAHRGRSPLPALLRPAQGHEPDLGGSSPASGSEPARCRVQRPPAGEAKAVRPPGRHHRALEEAGAGGLTGEGPPLKTARAPLLAPSSHAGAFSGPRPAEPRRPDLLVATTEPSKRGDPGAHRGRSPLPRPPDPQLLPISLP